MDRIRTPRRSRKARDAKAPNPILSIPFLLSGFFAFKNGPNAMATPAGGEDYGAWPLHVWEDGPKDSRRRADHGAYRGADKRPKRLPHG
jgi:hypothetical protein